MQFFLYFQLFRLPVAFLLDALFGDPVCIPHPVVLFGRLISRLEKLFRRLFPKTRWGERFAGALLVFVLCACAYAVPILVLYALFSLGLRHGNMLLLTCAYGLDLFWGWQCLAARTLRDEAENVYLKLGRSLEEGRKAVSRIVGRDTEALDRSGVIKACVETVAESTTDGVVSPMIAYCAGGAPLSLLYKAINTMDSMIGYKNERYRFFGTAAARLDDAANLLGARIAALCMIFSAGILRLFSFITGRVYAYRPLNALLVFARDRYCHQSPNSAQTESTCAGALGVQLAGDAFYEGVCEHKPTLGDELRPVHIGDIRHSVVLMYAASVLAVLLCTGVKLLVLSAFL